MTTTPSERLAERIFRAAPGGGAGAEGAAHFALLDAARADGIQRAITDSGLESAPLFETTDDHLRAVSPYLVRLDADAPLTRRVLGEGWGQSWGMFLEAPPAFADLRRHLRTFLRVRAHDGRVLYFRYYDPRVLRAYLPTCTADELKQVFGPIRRFDMEAEGGRALLSFSLAIDMRGRLSLDSATYPLE